VLAGGVHRLAGAKAQIGLTSFRFPQSQVDIWHKEYGGKTPFEDVIQHTAANDSSAEALDIELFYKNWNFCRTYG
jgi:hypothetical protein